MIPTTKGRRAAPAPLATESAMEMVFFGHCVPGLTWDVEGRACDTCPAKLGAVKPFLCVHLVVYLPSYEVGDGI
jgi:hypothetical protein